MANFDSNQWYHIYYNQNKDTAMTGGVLFNKTTQSGSSFFQPANLTQGNQQWQFYPLDGGFYALRTKNSGPSGFLGAKYSENEDTPGKTVPYMIRGNMSDDSAYWKVSPWGDGTFYLTNKANKTDWHLMRKQNSLSVMTSNITGDKPFQQFSFETISAIDQTRFSTVELPTSTVTSVPTGSTPADSSSGGSLSTGAKAGIGVGVALGVLILLVVGGLFLWQRRKRARAANPYTAPPAQGDNQAALNMGAPPAQELPQENGKIRYEAYGTPTAELHSTPAPVELPGEVPAQHAKQGR